MKLLIPDNSNAGSHAAFNPTFQSSSVSLNVCGFAQSGKGISRYWSEEFGNGRYLICSQWYAFENWRRDIDYAY
jgi:hypothetical protein